MLNILPYINSVPTMGQQVRDIRKDNASIEATQTNTELVKEQLLDIIQSRPERQRLLAAEAEDAELRLGVNQKYLEDLMLNQSEQAKNANDLTREQLNIQRQYGAQQAEAELTAAENQAAAAKQDLELGPQRKADLQAQTEARKAQAEAAKTTARLRDIQASNAKRQEGEAKIKHKYRMAYKILANTDRKDPQAVDKAITMLSRTEGVDLHEGDMQALRTNPDAYFERARSIAVDATAQYKRQTDRLAAGDKLAEIRARGEQDRATAYYESTLEGSTPVELKSHDRKANQIALKQEIATGIYGDTSIVREDSDDYDEKIARTIDEMTIRMQSRAEQNSSTKQEYYENVREYKDRYVSMFKSTKVFEGDIESAFEQTPKTLEELISLEAELDSMNNPNSSVTRFMGILSERGPLVRDQKQSMMEQARALGISEDVARYLIGGFIMKLNQPEGE